MRHFSNGLDGDWNRVSRTAPCPICGGDADCRTHSEEAFACCVQQPSEWRLNNGGWLHRISASAVSGRAVSAVAASVRAGSSSVAGSVRTGGVVAGAAAAVAGAAVASSVVTSSALGEARADWRGAGRGSSGVMS